MSQPFDVQKACDRLIDEMRNLDNSDGDRAAAYMDIASAAIAEVERLQAVVVGERARVLCFCHAGDLMYDMDVLEESNRLKEKHMGNARDQLRVEGTL